MNKKIFFILFLYSCCLNIYATANESASNMDVEDIIFSHIKDSYSWHIASFKNLDITLSLPVIVRSPNSGWHLFLSKRVEGDIGYKGFKIASEGRNQGKIVEVQDDGTEIRPLDLSFTKTAASIFFNSFIVIIIIMGVRKWYLGKKPSDPAPKGFVGLMEMLIIMVNEDIIKKNIKEGHQKYAPLLLTVFFFIFINNIMGIIPIFPAGGNVTGNIAVTLVLALIIFFVVNVFGNKHYWKDILWPDVPMFLKAPIPFIPIIEIIGILTKPFSLTIRLFANMMAGHAIILALACVILITGNLGPAIGSTMPFVTLIFMVFMDVLEILVSFIQAYVFTMLSAVFIGLSQQKEKK